MLAIVATNNNKSYFINVIEQIYRVTYAWSIAFTQRVLPQQWQLASTLHQLIEHKQEFIIYCTELYQLKIQKRLLMKQPPLVFIQMSYPSSKHSFLSILPPPVSSHSPFLLLISLHLEFNPISWSFPAGRFQQIAEISASYYN